MLNEPELLTFDAPDAGNTGTTHRLACARWGDPRAAHTVLCVHGLTRNGRDFDRLARALCDKYQVLCPDMPGRGRSDWLKNPADYNNATYVADLAFMLGALGVSRVQWVGTSMGGIIAMAAANAIPGLIQTLVLNDVGTIVSAEGMKRIAAYTGAKSGFASLTGGEAALRDRYALFGINTEEQWREFFAHSFEKGKDGRIYFTYDSAIAANLPKSGELADIDLWPLWEAMTKIPVLLIRGALSDILTHETAVAMQARHPRLTLHEVPGVGHAPSLMDGKETALIREWISAMIS